MYHWLAFVWVRYVLWLLLGILLGFALPGYGRVVFWTCLLIALLYIGLAASRRINQPANQLGWGLTAFLLVLLLGFWRAQEARQPPALPEDAGDYWWALAEEPAVETPNSYRFQARIVQAAGADQEVRAMVYLPKAAEGGLPVPGEGLLLKGRAQAVPAPFNPHEFDYRRYLASLGIYHQFFAQAYVRGQAPPLAVSPWEQLAFRSRRYFKGVVERFVGQQEAAAVVAAMVLGQRSELNRSLRQAYADAGVMHVLAVSGLHVGLVFAVLLWLLRYLQGSFWRRLLWLVVALLLLWSYAWLTGLSPSAQRATWMFSIIALGKLSVRKGNIYNSIALSAFILLLWNPLLLLQVGFQLSYAAVIGIVYLQPRISRLYMPRHRWIRRIWELMAVTLAAQLATFPLGLYYFNQFPTYFFMGNLLAIPLATLILYTTLLLMVLHWLPGISLVLGWLVTGLTQLLNFWVHLTEQLPGSRLVATIDTPQVLLLYGSLLALLLMLRLRSFGWSMFSLGVLGVLGLSLMGHVHSRRTQKLLTIYQIPGHSLLHLARGPEELLLPFGELPKQQQLSFHVEPSRIHAGFDTPLQLQQLPDDFRPPLAKAAGFTLLAWEGIRLAVVEEALATPPARPLPVDVVLIRNNARLDLQQLPAYFAPTHLVLDASNSQRYRQRARQAADTLGLPLHITSEQGAFRLSR
ncbi:ComEC/Rec2 family competence protein [Cesiribacter andamanensis]|uniref:ComEC family competence protein n=1 Tax=Cesiribacter andamanensis AMV16 TaxID=1279009 RepID=M7NU53_9BACT|nr:ComEC/Rec2 family competence protein [Cesiribacter andamanensis]EMR02024.1 ComEC family competence protein [Cesiribacter andamanensis AMV16]